MVDNPHRSGRHVDPHRKSNVLNISDKGHLPKVFKIVKENPNLVEDARKSEDMPFDFGIVSEATMVPMPYPDAEKETLSNKAIG